MSNDVIATRILGAFIEQEEPDFAKRVEPARELLAELKSLAESVGCSATISGSETLQIDIRGERGSRSAWVQYTGNARCFHVFSAGDATLDCKFIFEPSTGTFYTKEPDESVVPTPGAPLPTKTPLTVLAEALVEVLK